jgi:hypothetical protein
VHSTENERGDSGIEKGLPQEVVKIVGHDLFAATTKGE